VSEMIEAVREQFNKCARKFHGLQLELGSSEHKYWRFENCPADSCVEAKKALGLPVHHTAHGLVESLHANQAGGEPVVREPGQEG